MSGRGTTAAARRGARLGALLAAAAAISGTLATVGATASGGSDVVHGSGDLTGAVLYCSTDTVTLSGAYHYTENASVSQTGNGTWFSHGDFSFELAGVTGTGANGVSYRVVGATNIGYAFFFGGSFGGGDVEHSTETWRLVPSGGGRPLRFQDHFQLVSTPNGTTTLVDHGSGNCT